VNETTEVFLASFGFSHKQAAQPEKHQARLTSNYIPQQTGRFVAVNFTEGLASGSVKQVHKL